MSVNANAQPWDAARLRADVPGWEIDLHDRLDSTNAELVRSPRPGVAVIAEAQAQGRGRLGRPWTTSPGTAIAVSVMVGDPGGGLISWLPLVAGLAVREALRTAANVDASLKWPNDVLAGPGPEQGRKLAGLLAEWTPAGVVVGAGINIGQRREDLEWETATSVLLCDGHPDRHAVLTAYLQVLRDLTQTLTREPDALREAYRQACGTIGQIVEVHLPGGGRQRGTATGIATDGRLWVQTDNGPYAVSAGDVVHVRPLGP